MADENAKDRNDEQLEKGKAMGAGASGNYQGQQGQPGEQHNARGSQPNEVAGQGGGVQGTGQSQANPGGLTHGENEMRDGPKRGYEGATKEDKGGRKDE